MDADFSLSEAECGGMPTTILEIIGKHRYHSYVKRP